MLKGYGLTFIPKSWKVGFWDKKHKKIWAFGPFRYIKHFMYGHSMWWKDGK